MILTWGKMERHKIMLIFKPVERSAQATVWVGLAVNAVCEGLKQYTNIQVTPDLQLKLTAIGMFLATHVVDDAPKDPPAPVAPPVEKKPDA